MNEFVLSTRKIVFSFQLGGLDRQLKPARGCDHLSGPIQIRLSGHQDIFYPFAGRRRLFRLDIENLYIDPSFGHPSRDFAELPWFCLVQSLYENVPFFKNADALSFERPACGHGIRKEKVCDTVAVKDEGATALDAHPRAAQRLSHLC
jgi:hypothetical protein